MRIADGEPGAREHESHSSYFEQGADRTAARALPMLLVPSAAPVRSLLEATDGLIALDRILVAGEHLARAVPAEVRLHLARGLDRVWQTPCDDDGECHHVTALHLALESARDSRRGEWNPQTGEQRQMLLDDPVVESLEELADDVIVPSGLDAAIRSLAEAACADICVSDQARASLGIVLRAQRRALLAHDRNIDARGSQALVSARALLTLAAQGDDASILEHVDAFADRPELLGSLLRAISAAAAETPDRAQTARRIWPALMSHVFDLHESGHRTFGGGFSGTASLAALLPTPAGEVSYLYRELHGDAIRWWTPLDWIERVERWIPIAAGHSECAIDLIAFLRPLEDDERVKVGLPWLAALTLRDPANIARRTHSVPTWLVDTRATAAELNMLSEWQEIVDALVVAGESQLAPYFE